MKSLGWLLVLLAVVLGGVVPAAADSDDDLQAIRRRAQDVQNALDDIVRAAQRNNKADIGFEIENLKFYLESMDRLLLKLPCGEKAPPAPDTSKAIDAIKALLKEIVTLEKERKVLELEIKTLEQKLIDIPKARTAATALFKLKGIVAMIDALLSALPLPTGSTFADLLDKVFGLTNIKGPVKGHFRYDSEYRQFLRDYAAEFEKYAEQKARQGGFTPQQIRNKAIPPSLVLLWANSFVLEHGQRELTRIKKVVQEKYQKLRIVIEKITKLKKTNKDIIDLLNKLKAVLAASQWLVNPASFEKPPASITVTVIDGSGATVPRPDVSIDPPSGTMTRVGHRVKFNKVKLNRYTITARVTGHRTASVQVHVNDCRDFTVTIRLAAVPVATAAPTATPAATPHPTATVVATPVVTPGIPTATSQGLSATLSCGGILDLKPGGSSERCDIIVRGWKGNTADRVEVVYPQQSRAGMLLPGRITLFPGNTSADPANMFTPGVTDFYDRYIFGQLYQAKPVAPQASTPIRIIVRQGTRQVELTLVLRVGSGARSTGTGPANWCLWSYNTFKDPCPNYVASVCTNPRYTNPRNKYQLVGANMTRKDAGDLMRELSRYFDDLLKCDTWGQTPTPLPTATLTPTATPRAGASPAVSPAATTGATGSPPASVSPTAAASATAVPSTAASTTPTPSAVVSGAPSAAPSPGGSAGAAPTGAASGVPTVSPAATATAGPTGTAVPTATATAAPTGTAVPTATAVPSAAASPRRSPRPSPSVDRGRGPTIAPTAAGPTPAKIVSFEIWGLSVASAGGGRPKLGEPLAASAKVSVGNYDGDIGVSWIRQSDGARDTHSVSVSPDVEFPLQVRFAALPRTSNIRRDQVTLQVAAGAHGGTSRAIGFEWEVGDELSQIAVSGTSGGSGVRFKKSEVVQIKTGWNIGSGQGSRRTIKYSANGAAIHESGVTVPEGAAWTHQASFDLKGLAAGVKRVVFRVELHNPKSGGAAVGSKKISIKDSEDEILSAGSASGPTGPISRGAFLQGDPLYIVAVVKAAEGIDGARRVVLSYRGKQQSEQSLNLTGGQTGTVGFPLSSNAFPVPQGSSSKRYSVMLKLYNDEGRQDSKHASFKIKKKQTQQPPTQPGGLQNVFCSSPNIVIKVWDHASQDGDIISLRLGATTVLSGFNLNACGGPSEPQGGGCVRSGTLSQGRVAVSVYAHNEGSSKPNTAALKVEGGCTPELQHWNLKTGRAASIWVTYAPGAAPPPQ